ncbi:hypothetical protein PC116_g26978 [Phytophthora cactorum]|uniref:Uncharacterized protein n=1 Tax=Phytophthora cactorum TaxID=29920 RepID=A0A8T1AQ37_9STRA|nr:hypothetical protein PC114_g25354 [Phytophthora cactorum]KAG2887471.1 hypothetical protein PC117_g25151 [Phytophthora cactorum]KAG2965534.1 hypothetical protein PC119_g24972 [Phytophthora cactorum]KAG3130418.1 hypothetical protein C6341_g23759 [Phytophthora cactorum]KAG3140054.1 hypothetical protein PC128_g25266 [Phytophthora cactorum]
MLKLKGAFVHDQGLNDEIASLVQSRGMWRSAAVLRTPAACHRGIAPDAANV